MTNEQTSPLTAMRRRRRLSQSELARRLGVDPSTVSHLEAGRRRPSVELLAGILRVLDASPTETAEALRFVASGSVS